MEEQLDLCIGYTFLVNCLY